MKTNELNMYVVYHNGPNDSERPFYFKAPKLTPTFDIKCTCNLMEAKIFYYFHEAVDYLNTVKEHLASVHHQLVDKVKVGEICINHTEIPTYE